MSYADIMLKTTIKNLKNALRVAARKLIPRVTWGGSGGAINFFPQPPQKGHVIYKALVRAGIEIQWGHAPRAETLNVYWWDTTVRAPLDGALIDAFAVVNGDCTDIRKTTLDRCHNEVFGYGLTIDPVHRAGPIVLKSVHNARHDGRIVTGPLSWVPIDCVCQKLLNNSCGDSLVEDIRIPVINSGIPFVYRKYRPICDRFSNRNSFVCLDRPEILSLGERQKVLDLASVIGMDYGELDAIRDRDDGLLYVVDANNTPAGPPNGLDTLSAAAALCLLQAELLRMIQAAKTASSAVDLPERHELERVFPPGPVTAAKR